MPCGRFENQLQFQLEKSQVEHIFIIFCLKSCALYPVEDFQRLFISSWKTFKPFTTLNPVGIPKSINLLKHPWVKNGWIWKSQKLFNSGRFETFWVKNGWILNDLYRRPLVGITHSSRGGGFQMEQLNGNGCQISCNSMVSLNQDRTSHVPGCIITNCTDEVCSQKCLDGSNMHLT